MQFTKKGFLLVLAGMFSIVLGITLTGCDVFGPERDAPNETQDSSGILERKDILALSHLAEDHITGAEDMAVKVNDFFQDKTGSRSVAASTPVISGVKTFTSTVPTGFASKPSNARSVDEAIEPSDIPFYIFSLENPVEETEGFAITCGDNRIGDIIAVVENGAWDDPENPFLEVFYTNLGAYIMDTIDIYNSITDEDIVDAVAKAEDVDADNPRAVSNSTMYDFNAPNPPRLATQWNQFYPYYDVINSVYGRLNYSVYDKYVTGCVATAMAQIMAYHKWPAASALTGSFIDPYNTTQIKNFTDQSVKNYDWAAMVPGWPGYPSLPSGTDATRQIGVLMYEIGKNVNMAYGSSKTGGSSTLSKTTAIPAFIKMGYKTPSPHQAYSFSAVQSSIDEKKPVFIRAYSTMTTTTTYSWIDIFHWFPRTSTTPGGGHAWVIDDYRTRTLVLPIFSFNIVLPVPYVWCNLGGGGTSDGWYVSGMFDTKVGPVSATRSVQGVEGNFQFDIGIIPNITPNR
ncbi:hypothetical protein AGMMS50267_01140 [Spirochaetia bacterium]|nr:hypothetical protein AGMMS50267_01140 [Spirochaetia bacterium]